MKLCFGVFGVVVPAALAQILPVTSPISGLVFHAPSHSLRLLIGVPGAAYYGPPIVAADRGYPSPDGRFVILVTNDVTTLLQAAGSDAPAAVLNALLTGADQAVWSSDSKSAILFSSSSAQVQQIWFASGQWTASDPVPTSGVPDGASLIAAMSSCRCAVFSSVDTSARHYFIVESDGTPRPGGDFDSSVVAAVDSDDELYLASANQVQRIRLSDLVPVPEVVVQDTTLTAPAAILASQADNTLLVLTQDQRVLLYDLASRSVRDVINLAVNATVLRRLPLRGDYYQLTDPKVPSDTLYVLALGPPNKIFFVPALEP